MIEEMQTPNGEVVYKIDGRLTASRVDPVKEALRWLEIHRLEIERSERIVVLGCGSGHHLAEMAKSYPNKRQLVLDFELDLIRSVQDRLAPMALAIDFHWVEEEQELLSSSLVRTYMRSPFSIVIHPSTNLLHQMRYRELFARMVAREPLFFFEWVRREPRLAEIFSLQALSAEAERQLLSIKEINEFTSQRSISDQKDIYLLRILRELVK